MQLERKTPRGGPETVYNIEVDVEHVYYVSQDGILVHNGTAACATGGATSEPPVTERKIARRFDSNAAIKNARKNGIQFDPQKGAGIPSTSTNIEPVNPDTIKELTGARNADSYIDIDIAGKRTLNKTTKAGQPEIVIQEDVASK